jgi:hypothetical protein
LARQQSGACIDLSLWPSNPTKVDFLGQSEKFHFGIAVAEQIP